jgi:type II secretory pathway component PulF
MEEIYVARCNISYSWISTFILSLMKWSEENIVILLFIFVIILFGGFHGYII